jgi:hypothetical protein
MENFKLEKARWCFDMIKESKVFQFSDGKKINVTTIYQDKIKLEDIIENNFIEILGNIESKQP